MFIFLTTIKICSLKSMHHVHTLLLKTASASRFSSCLSSPNSRSSLRTSSSRTCSSSVLIRSLLWRIKLLQFYLCEILSTLLPLCLWHRDTLFLLWTFVFQNCFVEGIVFWFQEPQDLQYPVFPFY